MAEVIRVGRPVYFLLMEYGAVIDRLNFSNRILYGLTVLAIVVKEVTPVILLNGGNGFQSFIAGGVLCCQHGHCFLMDQWNGWVDQTARHGFVNRLGRLL